MIDAAGMSAIPGLVDCHTHAVWAGSRVDEFDRRAQGQSYEQIAAAGGGIKATVAGVRASSERGADGRSRRRRLGADADARHDDGGGEVGLRRSTLRSEATMLRAAHAAGRAAGVRVTGTCLALHALPPEAASAGAFVRLAIDEILPACAPLATAADCFLERGAFSADECRPFLVAARERGLRAAHPRRPVLRVRRDPARRRARRGVGRPPRADRRRGRARCWRRPAWPAVLPAAVRALPRPADAAGPGARRRRRARRARDRLQPRLGAVGVDARGDEPGLHAAAAVLRRGARGRHRRAGRGARARRRGRPAGARATPPTSS